MMCPCGVGLPGKKSSRIQFLTVLTWTPNSIAASSVVHVDVGWRSGGYGTSGMIPST